MKTKTKSAQKLKLSFNCLLAIMALALISVIPNYGQAQLFVNENVTLGSMNKGLPGGDFAFTQEKGEDFPMVAIAGHNVSKGFVRIYSQQYSNFDVIQDLRLNLKEAKLAWGDVDNDGDSDLLVCGKLQGKNLPIAAIYINENGKEFYRAQRLKGVYGGSVAFGDVDKDGHLDILMTGTGITGAATYLYRNLGGGLFTEMATGLKRVSNGAGYFADLDGDDDLDILLTGKSDLEKDQVLQAYRNDDGGFIPTEMDQGGLKNPTASFSDIDSDGDLDILMTGKEGHHPATVMLENKGGMDFEKVETAIVNVWNGNASFGDIDNDGDEDVFITGKNSHGHHVVKIYSNESGNWNEVEIDESISAHFAGHSTLTDYNADGNLDAVFVKAAPDYPRLSTLANDIDFVSQSVGMK